MERLERLFQKTSQSVRPRRAPHHTTQACDSALVDIINARKCPDPPVGARTAPGRGWTLAARRRVQKRLSQSGAYAPPQGRPTRPPPISRGPSRPLPTTHTLTRVGGPTGPRRWPRLHTAETTALTTHVVSFHPLILQHMPCRRRPGTIAAWKRQTTR